MIDGIKLIFILILALLRALIDILSRPFEV